MGHTKKKKISFSLKLTNKIETVKMENYEQCNF
jgi:hypothetical protein